MLRASQALYCLLKTHVPFRKVYARDQFLQYTLTSVAFVSSGTPLVFEGALNL